MPLYSIGMRPSSVSPSTTIRVRHTVKPKWLTKPTQDAIHNRDHLLKNKQHDEHKKQRNKAASLLRASKKKFFQDLTSSNRHSKFIWKATNELTNKNAAANSSCAKHISANELNTHFSTIAEKVTTVNRTESNDLCVLKEFCDMKHIQSAPPIPPMTITEVYNAFMHLKQTGTRGLDCLDAFQENLPAI